MSVAAAFVLYLAFFPDRAEKAIGMVAGLLAKAFGSLNKTAVAYKVQGAINSAGARLMKSAPATVLDGKLKVKWTDIDRAAAIVKEGEILVVMQRADHHEQNVARALMAFLPKAMLPRARRYVDAERMRAADLIMARALLAQEGMSPGALPVLFEEHLDPARDESKDLRTKIREVDEIDLEGWLTRVLLAEYGVLGDELYPGEPDKACSRDAEGLARFVYALASREKGDESRSLVYKSRHFNVAVIFVAMRTTLEKHGIEPYRKRAKRYIYRDQMDAVYLMAYDSNISAVQELADDLEGDGRVSSIDRYVYSLRKDFKKRKLNRDRAIAVCLRRRQVSGSPSSQESLSFDEDGTLPEEIFGADIEDEKSTPAQEAEVQKPLQIPNNPKP